MLSAELTSGGDNPLHRAVVWSKEKADGKALAEQKVLFRHEMWLVLSKLRQRGNLGR